MANTSLIKRSSVANKVPTTSDLSLGELAVNTYDGKLFLKKSVGGTESIVDLTNADKLDGQDGSYYTGYTDTAIANLIDSAPNALNTLNELSAALNDDASFSTTVTNSIATKLPLAGGTLTGNLTISKASADNELKIETTTSGDPSLNFAASGSGGHLIEYIRSSNTLNFKQGGGSVRMSIAADGTVDVYRNLNANLGLDVTGTCTATTFSGSGASLTNIPAAQLTGVLPALDGSNLTGLTVNNASTLDNLDSTQFLRSDTTQTFTGNEFTFSSSAGQKIILQGATDPYIRFKEGTTNKAYIQWNSGGFLALQNQEDAATLHIKDNFVFSPDNSNFYTIWHAGNDGSGSGLDADTLDGIDSGSFLRSNAADTFTNVITGNTLHLGGSAIVSSSAMLQVNGFVRTGSIYLHRGDDPADNVNDALVLENDTGVLKWNSNTVFHAGNDGSGSGLDSDTLDGQQGSYYQNASNLNAGTINDARLPNTITSNITGRSESLRIIDTRNDGARVPNDYDSHKVTSEFTNQINNGWWSTLTVKGWADGYAPWQLIGKSDTGQNTNLYVRFGHGQNNTWSSQYKIWHTGNDGSGSQLDADTLDGIQGSSYLRSDADDTTTGILAFTTSDSFPVDINGSSNAKIRLRGANDPYIQFTEGSSTDRAYVQWSSSADTLIIANQQSGEQIKLGSGNNGLVYRVDNSDKPVFHEGNDGSGSGLDADTLDGIQASKFLTSFSSSYTTGWEDGNRNFRVTTGGNAAGLAFHESDGTFAFQIYGDGSAQGFLTDNWSHWDLKKIYNGQLYLRVSGTDYLAFHTGNDGSGSGLDADTLDGVQGSSYLRSDAEDTTTSPLNINGGTANGTNDATLYVTANNNNDWGLVVNKNNSGSTEYGVDIRVGSSANYGLRVLGGSSEVFRVTGSGTVFANGNTVWHSGNDGSGSGLDADTLDGYTSGQFLRSDTNHTTTGNLTISKSDATLTLFDANTNATTHAIINFDEQNNQGVALKHVEHDGDLPLSGYGLVLTGSASNTQFPSTGTLSFTVLGNIYAGATSMGSVSRVLTTADEGSGNGLDADTVDGIQASSFLRSDANDTTTNMLTFTLANSNANPAWCIENGKASLWCTGTGTTNPTVNHDARSDGGTGARLHKWNSPNKTGGSYQPYQEAWYDGDSYHYLKVQTNVFKYDDNKVFHAGNDGSGSGLDADTLDGRDLSNSYTSTNSVVMRDSNGNMNAHYATLRKDVAGGVGAYLTIQNQSNNTNTSCGITFGAGTSNAILDGGDYGEAQIKCFRDSGGYGNLEINLHTGANRPVMKMIGNGGAYNGAGAGTEGMRGGVAFGNAGIAIDRSWMGQPGIHVFNANVENDTDQGTFRFHGWNRSYASYPNNTGSDFGVTLVADGMTLTSDRRRKTGITTITDALATVLQMRGVSYTYVNEELQPQTHMSMDNGKKLGFIAQEVIPLLPQLIHDSGEKAVERENGYCDRYNMDYGGVAPLLVEAIKELVQRIVALESK